MQSNELASVTVPYATSAESVVKAVVPEFDGAIQATVTPPAVYPEPETSPVALYAVVAAPIDAVAR
jgi:hypothetical protein